MTLNRPKQLNCISAEGNQELDAVWKWLDAEPKLCVGILTGTGRAFCAGADLKGMDHSEAYSAIADTKYQSGINPMRQVKRPRCHLQALADCHAAADASQ